MSKERELLTRVFDAFIQRALEVDKAEYYQLFQEIQEELAKPEPEPVAWLLTNIEEPLGDCDQAGKMVRLYKPKQYNPEWWRVEPLYLKGKTNE